VLSARAPGAIGVDAQILLVDLHFDLVADVGHHAHRGEARVAPALRVERRDPHQAVNPDLAAQVAVGVVARHGEGGALDTRLVPRLRVENLGRVLVCLAPAEVHAEQHLGPVAGLRAAGPGVHRDDRIAGVMLAREQAVQLGFAEPPLQGADALRRLAQRLGVLLRLGQLEQHLGVGVRTLERVEHVNLALEAALLAHQALGALPVVPERRVGGLLLEFGHPVPLRG
jgi:hypothetical protein